MIGLTQGCIKARHGIEHMTLSCVILLSGAKLPSGRELPQLFNFTENEMKIQPELNSQLIPQVT